MLAGTFMYEMMNTSAILGRDTGVSVTFKGDKAFTDGKVITLPSLGMDAKLSPEQVKLMRGYVDHEAGHHRHSDLKRIFSFYSKNKNENRPNLTDLHNILEDIWMEDKVIEMYPGAHKNLSQVNQSIFGKNLEGFKSINTKDYSFDAIKLGLKVWAKHYQQETSLSHEIKEMYSEDVSKILDKYVEEAYKCESSDDVIRLAKAIYKTFDEPPEGDSSSETQETPDPDQFDPAEGDSFDEGEEHPDDKGKGDAKREAEALGGTPVDGEGSGSDIPSMIEEEAEDGKGGLGGSEGPLSSNHYRVYSTEKDTVYSQLNLKDLGKGSRDVWRMIQTKDHRDYENVKNRISTTVKAMKAKLRRSLLARQQRDWDFGKEAGRLNSKRLVSGYTGNPLVYKTRTDRIEVDTAITVLVDLSGSMRSMGKDTVTRDCAVALAECFEGSNMPFKIVGFCNKGSSDSSSGSSMYHRYEPLDTVVFKERNQPLKNAKHAIANLNEAVGGNNSDYDFIFNEIEDLKKQPEKRKVLFVLSDGSPACYSDAGTGEHIKHIRKAISNGSKNGVECVGVGICSTAVKGIYNDHVVVNDVNDLGTTIFGKLTQILLGK